MSIRSAASCAQPRQLSSVPRGARTGRAPTELIVSSMAEAYPPSSRRITGKRSSAIARAKPTDSQNSGVAALVASGCAPIDGYVSTAVNPRPVRSSQTAATSARGVAGPAPLGRRRDAGDDRRQRRVGERRIEVARALRARVRGQRAELGVGRRDLVHEQHLGVAPGDAQAASEQLQLPRARRWGRPASRRDAGRTGCPAARHRRRRPASGTGSPGGRSRTDWPPAVSPRGRRGTDWPGVAEPCRRPWRPTTARARTDAPPSSRGRRPPSSRTIGGRSRGRRRAAPGRTSRGRSRRGSGRLASGGSVGQRQSLP